MANWSEIADLATGVGTLALAVATYSAVRASNRSARIAEEALLASRRPVLAPARATDPPMAAYAAGERLTLDLLYGDHEGGQRAISRFSLVPTAAGAWLPGVARHWRLDGVNPRD